MAQDKENFLARWSRLKQEQKLPEKPAAKEDNTEAPLLPKLEELTAESDFSAFMHPKVQDALRRAALKKLFSDPHFNVPDQFEAYSGDWTGGEPIPEEMLAALNQARTLLFDDKPKQEEKPAATDVAQENQDDEPGRENT